MNKHHHITRRTVLKMFGITAVTAVAGGASGVLNSCIGRRHGRRHGVQRLVFYFTGTGNSLYVAKNLSETPISIPQAMKEKNLEFEAGEIGIVFPRYGMPPAMVQEFVRIAKFKTPYFFAVMTYGNRMKTGDGDNFAQLLAQGASGVKLAYFNGVKMVDNRLQRFDMAQQLKAADERKIDARIAAIAKDIDAHRYHVENPADGEPAAFYRDHGGVTADQMFEITDACIGCGICIPVCPRGDYKVVDDRAQAQGACEKCLACAHACPQLAIVPVEGDENPKARYRNPNVSLREIECANRKDDVISPV